MNQPKYKLGDWLIFRYSSIHIPKRICVQGIIRRPKTPKLYDYYYSADASFSSGEWYKEDDLCTKEEYINYLRVRTEQVSDELGVKEEPQNT